jgi:hypothetical protein
MRLVRLEALLAVEVLGALIEYYSLWRFEQEEARNFSFCCFAREPNLY